MNLVTPIGVANETMQYKMLNQTKVTSMPKTDEPDVFTPSSQAFKGKQKVLSNPKGLAAMVTAAIATLTSFYKQTIIEEKASDKDMAYNINPGLTESLEKIMYKHGRDGDEKDPALNDRMILRIVEQNEQDPTTAIALKDFLNHNDNPNHVSDKQVDYMVNKFLENPEYATSLKQSEPEGTATILMLDEKDPEFTKTVLDKGFQHQTAEKLFEIGKKDKELRDKLVNSELYQPDTVKDEIVDNFKEHEASINGVLKLVKPLGFTSHDIDVLDWAKEYAKNPEKFEANLKKYNLGKFDLKLLKELNSMDDVAPAVEEYLKDSLIAGKRNLYYETNPLSVIQKNSPVISRIYEKVLNPVDRTNVTYKIVTELGKELDETMPRIIADGRLEMINSFDDLKKLSNLYNRYPEIKITDRMIQLNDDSKVNMFDISKL